LSSEPARRPLEVDASDPSDTDDDDPERIRVTQDDEHFFYFPEEPESVGFFFRPSGLPVLFSAIRIW
jgi:hypothetical protein